MIRITTLGGFGVHAHGREVTSLLGGAHHRALLVYLAVEREAPRTLLATLLWPRQAGGRARRELSRTLHELTRVLGEHWVTARDGSLRVPDTVEIDVLALEAAVQRGDRDEALSLDRGEFMPDLRADNQPLLASWLHTLRLRVQTLHDRARLQAVPTDATVLASPSVPAADDTVNPPAQQPRLLRLMGELQRRRVFRVAVAYGIATFAIAQGADALISPLAPDWVMRGIVIALLLGFPIAMALAWVFEFTDTGELRLEQPGGLRPALLWVSRSPWRIAGIGALVLGIVGAGAWGATRWPAVWARPGAALDDARYVVLPFERGSDVRSEFDETQSLYDALSRWAGIVVVDLFQVRDALGERQGAPSPKEAQDVAALLGAGRFTRGTVRRSGSALRIHTALHDTHTGDILADTIVHYSGAPALADSVYAGIATALLFRGAGVRDVVIDHAPGTRSFPARLAFERGHEALQSWDLEGADAQFATALELDPDYPRAAFWRAQVRNWSGSTPHDVKVLAERAAAGRALLTPREARLADALVLLANDRFRDACATYETLRGLNERDFAAWFGLGECHGNDDVVQADASSPSGWAFRSSYHQAIEAYRNAFGLLPSAHRAFRSRTFERVRRLLYTSTERVRLGRAASPDTATFLARPSIAGDTFAFVPFPQTDFAAGAPGTRPATHLSAVDRQRGIFHHIATSWVGAFPDSPDAQEALAVAEELLGDPHALATLQRARALAETPADRIRMGAREVILLVKFGLPDRPADLTRGTLLADSLLRQARTVDVDDATPLAAIAALTGRVFETADLTHRNPRPAHYRTPLPQSITAPAAVLSAYAALGGPADSITVYENLVEGAIRNRLPAGERAGARHHFLDRPASLAFQWAPLRATRQLGRTTPYPVLRAQAALLAGDTASATESLRAIRAQRRDVRPAEQMLDAIFPEAHLWERLGQYAVATAVLDSTLEQIRWTEPAALSYSERTASLVWAVMLRAELALARGDDATAQRWARAASILWTHADPPLRPWVARMQSMLDKSPPTSASERPPDRAPSTPERTP
jgi:tetratricopeptide (TPR) repeat protein/TolB-like protein